MTDSLTTGLLTLGGVLVGYLFHFLTSHIDRKERRHRLLREKYEELCENIQRSTTEVQQMLGSSNTTAMSSPAPTGPLKAHYIAMIYFPELSASTAEYSNGVATFRAFLFGSGFHPTRPATLGAQALSHPEFDKRMEHLMNLKSNLESQIERFASQYTRA